MRELRWNCREKNKCFRSLCPKLGEFDDCFPGRIGMSDVDGFVEIGGRFLFLEWKSAGGAVTEGQRIAFQNLTSLNADPRRVTVIVVSGDPETMSIESVRVFQAGKAGEPEPCDLDGLKARMALWAEKAQQHRTRPSERPSA